MKKKVLLIDDSKTMLETLKKILQEEEFECESTLNPQKALELVTTHFYPVIILDIKMPEMSGTELLRRIKKNSPCSQVIMLTGFGSLSLVVETLGDGAVDYFTKPIKNWALFVEALKQAFNRYERWHRGSGIEVLPNENERNKETN
jgi:DNA-binding NtrC family response regulator